MGQQLKFGTQFPLRPAFMLIDVKDSPHNIISDAAPVDWTAAGTIIDLLLDTEVMDDTDEITIDSTSFGLSLKEGQYEIDMHPVVHALGVAGTFRMAITNAGGTTIHRESDDFDVAAGEGRQGHLLAEFHLNSTNPTVVELRIAATNGDMDLLAGFPLATVRRIGNVDET